MRILFMIIPALIYCGMMYSQEVSMSKEFSIRTDYAYEVMGHVGENILLYRDKGLNKYISAFDNDLQFKWEQQLRFEEKRIKVYGITVRDTLFSIFHGMKQDGIEYVKVANYDQNARIQDSIVIADDNRGLVGQDFEFLNSRNKKKSLLYFIDHSDKLNIYIYDHVRDTLDWKEEFMFDGTNLFHDLSEVFVTDIGSVVLLLDQRKNKLQKDDEFAEIIILEKGSNKGFITQIPYGKYHMQSIKLSIDEKNKRLGFFALYNERKANWSQGYCYSFIDLKNFAGEYALNYKPFDKTLIQDIYGAEARKKKGLNFYTITDIIWRRDGGLLMSMEMSRQYSRRNSYDGVSRSSSDFYSSARGWVDYFNEDIILTALHRDGSEHWQQILYKKQFSQDDGGIYSSYYPFLTPSRLRLLYNDEIKNSNTVSEYVINGVGKYKRESLFSTEYQNLKLRFIDALQISSTEILVPSQKNYNLSLVKISYSD